MNVEAVLALVDTIVCTKIGKHLSDLQTTILREVWQGHKYVDIAHNYGCSEGHVKDVGYLLWKLLSEVLEEKVTKSNFRTVLERQLRSNSFTSSLENLTKIIPSLISNSGNFIGRASAIAHINTLAHRGSKVIVIQGEGGIGKTTLAQQYFQGQGFELVLELLMAKETQNITSIESVVEEWLKRDLNEEPGREFGVTLGRLKRHLQKRRIGILIDNLEPALDKQGKLIVAHRRYVELLRVLANVRLESLTLITSRDRLCESALNVDHYRLPGLDEQAWEEFFHLRQIQITTPTLKVIHKAYGGNAKAMGIICGAIHEDFEGDMNAYWRENYDDLLVETDLKNLVASQFNRLQILDSQAYRLLCRLGCYRYQDVPTVPRSGLLGLLWDVEGNQRRHIIESLRNRSLVEYSKGEYWLHPMIREEAIARCRINGEWERVNRQAAEFWSAKITTIATVSDALTAWEAYYHYVEIQDFEQASRVILQSRDNQWRQFLPLGSTLYRMGLLQPVLTGITQIIDQVESEYNLSELYNILGDLYWITGQIHEAISCQEKTISTVTHCLNKLEETPENKHTIYYLRMLEVDSLLSIGLYQIDLWELKDAASLFNQVITKATNTPHHRWAQKASVCLGLVNSYLGLQAEASLSADELYNSILTNDLGEHTGRFAYFLQILGQTYVNLGEIDKAREMYRQAIAFSQESHYTQVKAKALTGLAEIYRQQQDYESAHNHHREAIELLDKIGAKCDLAEAYFQFGLTWQKRGDLMKSKEKFEQAIQLFAAMKAPKQVEKVLEY